MSESADHALTAIDQLRCADDSARSYENPQQLTTFFLAAANIHALLAIAAAVKETGSLAGCDIFKAASS
jgi:hypothetical protein